eukprot:1026737-Rhodomonas_salina.1
MVPLPDPPVLDIRSYVPLECHARRTIVGPKSLLASTMLFSCRGGKEKKGSKVKKTKQCDQLASTLDPATAGYGSESAAKKAAPGSGYLTSVMFIA